MKKKHSLVGTIISIAFHASLFTGVWWLANLPLPKMVPEEQTSISIEMMAALLEQPQVAIAPEPEETEEAKEPEEQPEPEPVPQPVEKPIVKPKPIKPPKEKIKPKPVEKPKQKPKEKPKEKPKAKEQIKKKDIPPKALETGAKPQQGVVAKAVPNALQGTKLKAGEANGSPNSTAPQSVSNSNEINAYKIKIQRTLQQQADNAYPYREKMMRKTGKVILSFSVSSAGRLLNVSIQKSSGNSNLDNAAIKAAEKTQISSAPPSGFPSKLTVPVDFSIES